MGEDKEKIKDKRIFENFPNTTVECVDCEECEHCYNGTCDGLSEGSSKPCKSFLATRRVVSLRELEALRERLNHLRAYCVALNVIILAHLLIHVFLG